jgi:hypothetical protein
MQVEASVLKVYAIELSKLRLGATKARSKIVNCGNRINIKAQITTAAAKTAVSDLP